MCCVVCRAARKPACRRRCVRRSARTSRSWRTKSPSCSRRTWRSSCRPFGSCSWRVLSRTATTWWVMCTRQALLYEYTRRSVLVTTTTRTLAPGHLQLTSKAIEFLTYAVERPSLRSLFAENQTLQNICDRIVIPNMQLRSMLHLSSCAMLYLYTFYTCYRVYVQSQLYTLWRGIIR